MGQALRRRSLEMCGQRPGSSNDARGRTPAAAEFVSIGYGGHWPSDLVALLKDAGVASR